MTSRPDRAAFLNALGHEFVSPDLIEDALTHRSYVAEHDGSASFERLEFLGDAVLQLVITEHLFAEYPRLAEGELAKVRASVVNAKVLAQLARQIDLSSHLRVGRGEELTDGRNKTSILADAMEALLGAVYLDAGYEAARHLILTKWKHLIDERARRPGRRDYKTRLQETLAQQGRRPVYRVTESGPEHAKHFDAIVTADDDFLGAGSGTSKKRAEQAAAENAVAALQRRSADRLD